jgi:signal transduction histidine kinase
MNLYFRERLTLLIALVVALVLALAYLSVDTANLLITLRHQTSAAQFEGLKLADHIEKWTLRANQLLLLDSSPQRAQRFDRHASDLRNWLQKKESLFNSPDERTLLTRIHTAFTAYTAAADFLLRSGADTEPHRFELERASTELLARAIDLGQLHARRQATLVAASESSLRRLQIYALLSLLALCIAVATLMWRAYRIHVAPLRLQVIEARELAARQEKLASLGVLAAGVAHEIRNPLTAVKARLFTLGRRLLPDSPALTDTHLIGAEITRLEKIVQDFLTFARPRDLERSHFSARALVEEIRALLADPIADEQKTLILEDGPDAQLHADRDQLKQVLINLVRNAAEAVAPATGQVTLRVLPSPDHILLEVSDNGPGIPAEVQSRLFDPFFSTKSAGTGLGLSIALRIVELHQGKLRYQTTLTQGTTFGILLPAN